MTAMHRLLRLFSGAVLLTATMIAGTAAPAAAAPRQADCTGANTTDLTVNSTTRTGSSSATVLSCHPNWAGTTVTVELRFTATSNLTPLDVYLSAPNGTGLHLVHCKEPMCGAMSPNTTMTFTLYPGELREGAWTLSLYYGAYTSSATLDSWTVTTDVARPLAGCYGTNASDVPINGGTVQSRLPTACYGMASARSTVEIAFNRTSLVTPTFELVAQDGRVYPLDVDYASSVVTGMSMRTVTTVNLSAEQAYQSWRLRVVSPPGYAVTGVLDSWTLNVAPVGPQPAYTASASPWVYIMEHGGASSAITVSGSSGNASDRSTVTAWIDPHFRFSGGGNITGHLIAPDGSRYMLDTVRLPSSSADPIKVTFPVNPSLEQRNGTWTLFMFGPTGPTPAGPGITNSSIALLTTWVLTI